MAFDRTTETIAHFAGVFSLAVEKMIQRQQYDKFQAAKNADDDLEAINAASFRINSDYRLKEYDPELDYRPPDSALTSVQPGTEGEVVIPPPSVSNAPFDGPTAPQSILPQSSDGASADVSFVLPLPSSVVTVTLQFNDLDDNDSFSVTAENAFAPPVYFDVMVAQVVEIAESLQGIASPVLPVDEDGWQPFAVDTLEQIEAAVAADQPSDTDVSVSVLSGDATTGITIDGEVSDEVPDIADLLPEFLQTDEETEDTAINDEDTASDEDGTVSDATISEEVDTVSDDDIAASENGDAQTDVDDAGSVDGETEDTAVNDENTASDEDDTVSDNDIAASDSDDAQTDEEDVVSVEITASSDDTSSPSDGEIASSDDVSSSDTDDAAIEADESDTAASLLSDDVDASVSTQDGAAGDNTGTDDSEGEDTETTTQDETVQVDETATDATETTDVDTLERFDEAFEDGRPDSPYEVEDGHLVVAGANTQLNETQLSSNWLDAEVIVVQGDVYDIEAVSQVNVSFGSDVVNGELSNATSTALSIVEIVETSSEVAPEEDESEDVEETTDTAAPEPQLYTGLPSNSVVVHAQGNVTQINWTVQESYLNDHDTAVVTIAASATYIGLGDNDEYNETFLSQSGFNYDLIYVDGDLTDVTVITQTNVLLDGGDIDVGELVNVESGDNLQVNLAQLNTVGIDTHVDLDEDFEQDLIALQDGAENVSDEVAGDDLFEGTELLRVLHIAGDLTTVNVTIQNNVLGDVDQLNVAHAAIEAAQNLEGLAEHITADVEAQVQVVTGSNAQANVAVLNEFGIDSTVMAGGEVYSDALIYQAELIDTGAIPTGVELSALSNDAIAILVQETADLGNIAEDIIATTNEATADLPGAADIMQSVLA